MEVLHNLKQRICDFENLMCAYREAAKNKRYRQEVIDFSLNLGENLLKIRNELEDMTYTVGKYREFYVRYPKPRLVMALAFRDRIVQWAIYRQVNPYLDKRYITHSYGCREGKGTLAAALCLHNWQQLISRKTDVDDWYLIKGDIAKYFYRVNHAKVRETYDEVSDDIWFRWLIGIIIDNPDVPFGLPRGAKPDNCPRHERLYEVGMPIGNLTSQETANLFLDRLDQFCKHQLKLHFYVRYMDDFCIFVKGNENAKTVYREIETFLRTNLYLDISPKSKIQKARAPVEFVGYLMTPHGIRMRKKTTRHIKRSLKHVMAGYAAGEIELEKALESAASYLGMCKHCRGYNMRRWILDNFVLQKGDNMNKAKSSGAKRRFYSIHNNADGSVDVYLRPIDPADVSEKGREKIIVVKNVEPHAHLEEEIRAHYYDWCEGGEEIYL